MERWSGMNLTDLAKPWGLAWQNAGAILERLDHHQAHALRISADGVEVYTRLLIPKQADLEAEAALFPSRATTQDDLLRAAIIKLAHRHPNVQVVTIDLLWGGIDGVKIKPLVTFGKPAEVKA